MGIFVVEIALNKSKINISSCGQIMMAWMNILRYLDKCRFMY